jgi:hypothetical protein
MVVMMTQVNINGIDVTSKIINYEYERSYGDAIATTDIEVVKTISNLLTLDTGQTVTIYRGWVTSTDELIFNGYIESFEPEGGTIKIICKDKLWDLVRKEVTHTYDSAIDTSAGVISEIFKDLVTTYGGLTVGSGSTTVQDSGIVILLNKFVCNHADIMERCKALAKILDWQFYYRADTNKVYFEPKGFTSNSTILTVGSNIMKVPKWTYDNTEMVNDLTVVGAFQEIETTESGQIGVTAGYTISYAKIDFKPISVKVYNDNNNPPTTLKVGGIPESSTTYDYYVDINESAVGPDYKYRIMPYSNFALNSFMEIRYSHAVPIPIHMTNEASISQYGQFKKTITYKDLRGISDAENRGANYLVRYSSPFIYTTLKVKNISTYNLKVGDMIRVVDNISAPTVDRLMVVSRARIRWPADYDELVVGDKAWRLAEWQSSVEERLKRMAEEEFANQDLITELITADNTIANSLNVAPRYRKILTQDYNVANNIMIWNNVDHGIWGSDKWGVSADAFSSEANHFIQQYKNTYNEEFYDTDFKDTSTTADWDTTNEWLRWY